DLITANFNTAYSVSVLLGNGDGSFQSALTSTRSNIRNQSSAVADLNGDGKLDAVTVGSYTVAAVWLGNGNGTFQTALFANLGHINGARDVAVGDFNRDGKPDLVTANSLSNDVSVLLGNGDGSFQSPRLFACGTNPNAVAAGDF